MSAADRIKLNATTWDSDKDPAGFAEWSRSISSIVKSTKHGQELEKFLDRKLGRDLTSTKIVPSFIANDNDFRKADDAYVPPTFASPSSSSSRDPMDPWSSMSGGKPTLRDKGGKSIDTPKKTKEETKPPTTNYFEMTEGARELDALMYNVLVLHVKGSKKSLLESVAFESYIQAIMILQKHCDISKSDRKTKALLGMEKLKFTGDVQAWQITAIKLIKELMDSKVSIMDFAMANLMKSLDGKSKTIQYSIAARINNDEITTVESLYDMIQEYACAMSSVGDGTTKQGGSGGSVNQVDKSPCKRCGRDNHDKSKCMAKKHLNGTVLDPKTASRKSGGPPQKPPNGPPKDNSKTKCHNCGELGHMKKDCPKLKDDVAKSDNKSFTVDQLGEMMASIKAGKVTFVSSVSMVSVASRDVCSLCLTECDGDCCSSLDDNMVALTQNNQNMGLDGASMPKSLGIADTMPLVCRYHGRQQNSFVMMATSTPDEKLEQVHAHHDCTNYFIH